MSRISQLGRRGRAVLVVGSFTILVTAVGATPAVAGADRPDDASTSTSASATAARKVADPPTTKPSKPAKPSRPAPATPTPPPTAATPAPPVPPGAVPPGAVPPGAVPPGAVPPGATPPADPGAPLQLAPGITADTPPEPHVIPDFAGGLRGPRRGAQPPNGSLSVPVRADIDGCDRNYGEATQCVPKTLPGGQKDLCAYLAKRGVRGVRVKGPDARGVDLNRNGVVCD